LDFSVELEGVDGDVGTGLVEVVVVLELEVM
jgi:hypothetical protein